MRSILIFTFMMFAMVQPAFGEVSIASAKTYRQFNPQEEARHLWEQAIAAKGGRERLRAVRNKVASTHGEYMTRLFKRN